MNDDPSSAAAEPDFGVHFNRYYRSQAASHIRYTRLFYFNKFDKK